MPSFIDKPIILKQSLLLILLAIIFSFLWACSNQSDTPIDNLPSDNNLPTPHIEAQQSNIEPLIESQALIQFLHIVEMHFEQLTDEAKLLREQLIAFTKEPTKEGYSNSISALEVAHARFVSGYFLDSCCSIYSPVYSSPQIDIGLAPSKTTIDQYPLLPGYLDVVEGYPFSGLVYSDIPITREAMVQEFQLGDPAYVTLGFHPLDVILKGSNQKRKIKDFSALSSASDSSSAPPELRRTLYAILLATEIERDINTLRKHWKSNLELQLINLPKEQADNFILDLTLKAEKKFQESSDKTPQNYDEHWDLEIQNLHASLLEQLISINKL